MNKLLFTLLFFAAGLTCLATDYYVVGDATIYGAWGVGESYRSKMTETASGVYVWTGLLKKGSDGFIICNGLFGWTGYGAPTASYSIGAPGGTCTPIADANRNDWNPTNTDFEYYTCTTNRLYECPLVIPPADNRIENHNWRTERIINGEPQHWLCSAAALAI